MPEDQTGAVFDLESSGTGKEDGSSSSSSSDSEDDSENDDSEEEREKRLKELQEQVSIKHMTIFAMTPMGNFHW